MHSVHTPPDLQLGLTGRSVYRHDGMFRKAPLPLACRPAGCTALHCRLPFLLIWPSSSDFFNWKFIIGLTRVLILGQFIVLWAILGPVLSARNSPNQSLKYDNLICRDLVRFTCLGLTAVCASLLPRQHCGLWGSVATYFTDNGRSTLFWSVHH